MIDFLVIGGGIAGVSAAARLAPLGSVQLIEAEDHLAYHASGRSAAMFEKSYGNAAVRALNAASEAHLMTCANGAGVLTPRGFIVLASHEQASDAEGAFVNLQTSQISVDEAVDLCPILNREVIAAAAYTDDARDLDTDLLIQDFAKDARLNGAEFVTGTSVTAITRKEAFWEVTTSNRRSGEAVLQARQIVNAAGAWADQVAMMAGLPPLDLTPFRRSMARMPAPGRRDARSWPMLLDAAESWYAKPDAGGWIVSPCEEHACEPHDAFADDMVVAEAIARYQEFVTEPVTRVETTWAGLRTFAPDRALVLGPDPCDRAFIWCAGQGGYGFQTCAAASQIVAATVGGMDLPLETDIARALLPDRFDRAN